MRNLFFVLFFLFALVCNAQQHNFKYKSTLVSEIITDLEDRFDVHFSYRSSLLTNLQFSYKGNVDLKSFLDIVSEEMNLEFIFLDEENIVIKSSFDSSFDVNALDEIVVVTEYLTAGFDQNKKDGSITMNPNKLGILPGLTEPDVLQSLQLLPGVSSPTESASNLHIRGGTPDQNLVLYDGIKIYHQGHLFGMISPFNPYIVESVDIFRSGTKAQFGDRIAGVIDLNSLAEIPSEFSGGAGSNFLHTDAYIKTPLKKDKIGLLVSVRRSINDIVNLPTFNSLSNKVFQNTIIEVINNQAVEEELAVLENKFNFIDANAKLIFTHNKSHKISISSLLVDNSLNYENSDEDTYGTRDLLDVSNKGVSVQWDFRMNEKWNFNSIVKFSEFKSGYSFEEFFNNSTIDQGANSNLVKDIGIQVKGEYAMNSNSKLNVGYDYTNLNVNYSINFGDNNGAFENDFNKLSGHHLFIENEYKGKNFYARIGVRTSYLSEFERVYFEPRFYADYQLNESFKVRASAEVKNQAISQLVSFEFNNLGIGNSIWALADDDGVPVLNNKQFSFGFLFDKNGWKLDVESYYKKVKGLTSFTRGFSSTTQPTEFASGNSTVVGFDVLLKKRINKFRTWLGYTFSKNNFEFSELQNGKFPGNFDQRHVISWANTYKYKKFQFSLGWQFATGKPYSVASGFQNDEVLYSQQNNARLSNYHKLDASAFHDFYLDTTRKIKARLGVSIINVYGRNNVLDKSFKVEENSSGNDVLVEQTNIGLGITPNFVFRVYF
ncbi:MAG: TonB-dependent receptor plug domain-containing protein [Flavobacteriaceae bacterium]